MKKVDIFKNLIKMANELDKNGLYQDANSLTKIALDIYNDDEDDIYRENPLDINIKNLDMDELFDNTVQARIVELDNTKGMGKADIGDTQIVNFVYLPEKKYDVIEKSFNLPLETDDIVILAEPGFLVDGYAAMAISSKSKKNKFMMSDKVLE